MNSQLIHYTKDATTVGSILRKGFLLIPNQRHLLGQLVEDDVDWGQEAQEWGMICFSELPVSATSFHRQVFGDYGIAVSWEWARKNHAEAVLYLRLEGPLFDIWKHIFTTAYRDAKMWSEDEQHPWDGPLAIFRSTMAAQNRAIDWAVLLKIHEYMQPHRDSAQVEWRIVNKYPFSFSAKDKAGMIEQALKLADTWQLANLRLQPDDVNYLICPLGTETELRDKLPSGFSSCEILEL